MSAALILLFTGCLLQGGLCKQFKVNMPQEITILRGSCVTIPCSFDIKNTFESKLDHTCTAKWLIGKNVVFDSKTGNSATNGNLTGDLTKKDCTTTLNSIQSDSKGYQFRLECRNEVMHTFPQPTLGISVKADPPKPTLIPSTLEVKEGTSVTLKCSAPAPCLSRPPNMTWNPSLGEGHETMEDNPDRTKVKTSVLNFTVSHLDHRKEISCTATYNKQDGSTVSSVSTSLTAVVSFPPQILNSSSCTKTATEVNCSCDTVGNPFPALHWYLDGLPVNHSDKFSISTDPLNDTSLRSIITVNQSHWKHLSTLICNSSNSLGSTSQPIYINTHEQQTSAESQGQVTLTILIIAVVGPLLLCALLVIRAQTANFYPPKRQSTGDTNLVAVSQFLSSTEGNKVPNTEEEQIYVNINQLVEEDVPHSTSSGAGERLEKKNEDENVVIYSSVKLRSKHDMEEKQQVNPMDPHMPGSYTLEMGNLYEELETRKVKKEVECEYSQVKF